MAILSIQSAVAYGHVGNSAAVFPLQRLGHEVWPVDTVQFSNHTGYGAWRGRAWEAAGIAEVIAGIGERGQFARCPGLLGEPPGQRLVAAVARRHSSLRLAAACAFGAAHADMEMR